MADEFPAPSWNKEKWMSVYNCHQPTIRDITECLGFGLSSSANSSGGRGIPKFDDQRFKEVSSEVQKFSKKLPTDRETLLEAAADPAVLKQELDGLLEKYGHAIWGKDVDRKPLMAAGQSKNYPRDLFYDEDDGRQTIRTHLHRWVVIKAIYFIRNQRLKKKTTTEDDALSNGHSEASPAGSPHQTQLFHGTPQPPKLPSTLATLPPIQTHEVASRPKPKSRQSLSPEVDGVSPTASLSGKKRAHPDSFAHEPTARKVSRTSSSAPSPHLQATRPAPAIDTLSRKHSSPSLATQHRLNTPTHPTPMEPRPMLTPISTNALNQADGQRFQSSNFTPVNHGFTPVNSSTINGSSLHHYRVGNGAVGAVHTPIHSAANSPSTYHLPPPLNNENRTLDVKPISNGTGGKDLARYELFDMLLKYLYPKNGARIDENYVLHQLERTWAQNKSMFAQEMADLYEKQHQTLESWIDERRRIAHLRNSTHSLSSLPEPQQIDRLLALNDLRIGRLKWKAPQDLGYSAENLLCKTFAMMTDTKGTEDHFKNGLERLNEEIYQYFKSTDMTILVDTR